MTLLSWQEAYDDAVRHAREVNADPRSTFIERTRADLTVWQAGRAAERAGEPVDRGPLICKTEQAVAQGKLPDPDKEAAG